MCVCVSLCVFNFHEESNGNIKDLLKCIYYYLYMFHGLS